MPEVDELMRYWQAHPPAIERLAAMMSGWLGVEWGQDSAPRDSIESVSAPGGLTLESMATAYQRAMRS